jgi:hypothetical protein
LIYLPAHTSHVLQPLDVGVFGPVKAAYRKHISNHSIFTDSSPIGKANILRCYAYARKEGMTMENILSAWKGSGLYPVNSAKPLMSGLLLNPSIPEEPRRPVTPENAPSVCNHALSQPCTPPRILAKVVVETPKGARQVYTAANQYFSLRTRKTPTARLLIRKVGESMEAKKARIATLETENLALQAQVAASRPSKRGKVKVLDLNKRFASIEDIMRTQQAITANLQAIDT